ncbi:MAG: hypothetical protein V2B18_20870, partial [Pseudomonadota bacterium]
MTTATAERGETASTYTIRERQKRDMGLNETRLREQVTQLQQELAHRDGQFRRERDRRETYGRAIDRALT